MPLIALMLLAGVGLWGCIDRPPERPPPDSPITDDSDEPADSPPVDTLDLDGDGWTPARGDCDDTDPSVHPRAPELPDGIDQDCDGRIDEGTIAYDDDRDGVTELEGDCDDTDPYTSPLATDYTACDGVDQDCNGLENPCDSLDEAFLKVVGSPYDRMAHAVAGGVDMSGDGRPDMLAYDGDLYVWTISDEGGLLDTSDLTAWVSAPDNPNRPDGLVVLGDSDGDGFAEVVMSSQEEEIYVISAPLVGGSYAEYAAVATYVHDGDSDFGWVIDAGRDASGDGVVDLLLSAYQENESIGSVYLVSGDGRGVMDMSGAIARIHGDEPGDGVGLGARFTGDNDGDGLEDVLVTGGVYTDYSHRAGWFSGPIGGSLSLTDADVFVEQTLDALCFVDIPHMGDVDGDGRDDLILHNCLYSDNRLYIFTNGLTPNVDEATARIQADQFSGSYFGRGASVVDVNGDGLGDVIGGAWASGLGGGWVVDGGYTYYTSGAAALFLSPLSGTYDFWDATRVWAGETPTATLGYDVANVGDINGDGFGDFALASPEYGNPDEEADAFRGAAYLLLGKADW